MDLLRRSFYASKKQIYGLTNKHDKAILLELYPVYREKEKKNNYACLH